MRCVECEGQMDVPPDKEDAICKCGAVYELVDNIGWFGEFLGLYVRKDE